LPDEYVLGHSEGELARLDLQGALYRHITERVFLDAGLAEGMQVLDIGCGSGDVTRLAGQLVGQSGSVLGIDCDEGTIQAALARLESEGSVNVSFRVQEIGTRFAEESFDALVGRFVLMHQDDAGNSLARAAACVRPGGLVVMIESNMESLLHTQHSAPKSTLYDKIVRWKCRVVEACGADLSAGLRLRSTFLEAGLPEPELRMHAPVEGGVSSPIYAYMADSCRSMLPRAKQFGIDGMDEESVDSLEDRLRHEIVAEGGVIVGWPVVAAWCRT
jgi:ubiquinone/menaquinone biosynthesis C-methylase UbiE